MDSCRIPLSGFIVCLVLLCLCNTSAGHVDIPALDQREHVGSWYAWNNSGTYAVSGNRVVLFENVQVPEELAARLLGLVVGAGWKESYLLFHEFFGDDLYRMLLPESVHTILKGVSQGWLMWTLARSLIDLSGPVTHLVQDYRQVWNQKLWPYYKAHVGLPHSKQPSYPSASDNSWGKRFQGSIPIPVNDVDLSFRIFMRAVFPESMDEPVMLEIDRIPPMQGLPKISRPHAYLNPWDKLISEMEQEDIHKIQLAGSAAGTLQLKFPDVHNFWREQVVTTSLDAEYQPVPWLMDMIRKGVSRQDIQLYTSLLSHDVLDLASQMLSCRRLNPEVASDKPAFCALGQLSAVDSSLRYQPYELLIPPQIWENRDYALGRVLPLSGCNFSDRPLCWENYLVWSNSSFFYPWPAMTLYSRFSGYDERAGWLLLGKEPQVWRTSSNFQIRVPELVTRMLLNMVSSIGQVVVNRAVTSLHHNWWGKGTVSGVEELPPSKQAPKGSDHQGANKTCSLCLGDCNYSHCCHCQHFYETDSMINTCAESHYNCRGCFQGWVESKGCSFCQTCKRFHRSSLSRVSYPPAELGEKPPYPFCPLCNAMIHSEVGNVGKFLNNDCGNLRVWMKWLFSDGLTRPEK